MKFFILLVLLGASSKALSVPPDAIRIISLSPHITELVFAAGAGDKLVGVDGYSDYPPAAKIIPKIGDAFQMDFERIVALKPDLIIAWKSGNTFGNIEKLESLGLQVLLAETGELGDVPKLLRLIGARAATEKQAERAAQAFEMELAYLRKTYFSPQKKLRVFYPVWHQPLMTLNNRHIISDVLALCGGENIFGRLRELTPVVSVESVLAENPDAIVSSAINADAEQEIKQYWKKFSHLRAVAKQRFIFVHPDLISRPTPRILQGARALCEQMKNANL